MTAEGWRSDTRGAVYVEQLIAYLPVMVLFLSAWQLVELCAAHLLLQRAASAAARAAIVVLPDDPNFYGNHPVNSFGGKREQDVKLAASMVLATSPHYRSSAFDVAVTGATGNEPLTATVQAAFTCQAGWVSFVCGLSGSRRLTARATYVYQGANYNYEL